MAPERPLEGLLSDVTWHVGQLLRAGHDRSHFGPGRQLCRRRPPFALGRQLCVPALTFHYVGWPTLDGHQRTVAAYCNSAVNLAENCRVSSAHNSFR